MSGGGSEGAMGAAGLDAANEMFTSFNDVVARRESEVEFARAKLERNEVVDLPLCRMERVGADQRTVRFGLKRGKLLYVFKYPDHDVERDKHRNVVTRARFVKAQLEAAGYYLIPWDFKKGQPPRFWDDHDSQPHSQAMEEEDDDLYGPAEPQPHQPTAHQPAVKPEDDPSSDDEPMDEGLESGEDDDDDDGAEESDSDSDLEIIIDKPPAASKTAQQQQQQPQVQESKAIKIEAPPTSSTPSHAPKTIAPHLPTQPGTAYPAVRTSTIDVNADPIYPPEGKPISQVDMDADLAESTKPWRLPGADQSDYFNYGFDEFTWEMYRQRQQSMVNTLATQKAETAQMQAMFGNGIMGGPPTSASAAPPTAPTGPAAAPAAPPGMMNEEMMNQMMAQMMAQGMDPSNMDFNAFMQMAGQGMPGFGGPGGNQGGFGGGGGGGGGGNQGGGGGGRRGGRGRGW